jgi:HAD superfamily hydrolase (TIGR01459 family)
LAPLAPNYEGFVLDLWGVIHDGVTAFPWAVECLARLRHRGSRAVLLSNAPRRSSFLIEAMTRMGIPRPLYVDVVSSGDIAFEHLQRRDDPFYAALGPRCFHLGPERDRNMLEVPWLVPVNETDEADFILATGPRRDDLPVAAHEEQLAAWARRKVPMVCVNPDRVVIRGGERIVCAGALAERYETLGGPVRYHGKPYPDVYERCLEALGIRERDRVLAVGDSLATDIKGAATAGIDSLLVAAGIHGDEFGTDDREALDLSAIAEACRRHGVRPIGVIPRFAWGVGSR